MFLPSLRTNASGAGWAGGPTPGTSLPMSQFFVATPSNTAAQINAALAQGCNLFFTPGVYNINQTLNVTNPNTVVLGIGFPTLIPQNGVNTIQVADVDGVRIESLLFDFFQNEMPYDPPNQAAWMNGSSNGYAAYQVAPGVTTHQAYGLGSYCFFNVNKSVVADHAFETSTGSGIHFHDILTVSLGGVGVIEHVINETGGATPSNTTPVDLVSFP